MTIPLVKAELLALCLEDFLFGVFATLAILTTVVLFRDRSAKPRSTLLSALACMLCFATAHIIIDYIRIFQAFDPDASQNATTYFANLRDPIFLAKSAFMTMQVTFGDCVNIWRCFIVCKKRIAAIIAPVVGMVGGLVSGIAIIVTIAQSSNDATIFDSAKHWIMPYFILTMCVNIYCTVTILWVIYSTKSPQAVFNRTRPAITVIIESGSLYTASILGFLSAYFAGSNGQYPALDVVVPLVGIIYCLIILQTNYLHGGEAGRIGSTRIEWPLRRRAELATEPDHQLMPRYTATPLAIQITREVERLDMERDSKDVVSVTDLPKQI